MAKTSYRTKSTPKKPENTNIPLVIFKGVAVSIVISLLCAVGLSVISLLSEDRFIENYLEYIMVAITMVSIFAGSVYATKQTAAKGLLIGCAVGGVYVLFSIGVSLEFAHEQVSWLMLVNKFAAGSLAGALGGFIGVNL